MTDLQQFILNTLEQEIVELTHSKYGYDIREEDYEETTRDFIRWLSKKFQEDKNVR